MTADEWETTADLKAMLAVRQVRNRKRPLRLFAVGCCRQLGKWVSDDTLWDALAACERFADGEIKESGLARWVAAVNRARAAVQDGPRKRDQRSREAALHTIFYTVHNHRCGYTSADGTSNVPLHTLDDHSGFSAKELARLRVLFPHLLRDVFGNPFRPVQFAKGWRSESAVSLARTAYDTRDFTLLPVLADALEEAGCDHAEVLSHCRGPGPHVRGCWVVDLVLGKS